MRFRQIRYFVAVATAGSFSRAADILHVAQPAISNQVASLEEDLGVQLFIRHSRGVELTPTGKAFLSRAEQILALLEVARSEVASLPNRGQFHVRLGLPTTAINVVAQPTMKQVRETMSDVALHIVEGMTGHLEKWLESEEIDLALLYDIPGNERMHSTLVGQEQVILVGPDKGALAEGQEIDISTLSRLPLIHTTKNHQLRRLIDKIAAYHDVELHFVAEIDSLPQIKAMVSAGDGYTIVPIISFAGSWDDEDLGKWKFAPGLMRIDLMLTASVSFRRHPIYAELTRTILGVFRDLVATGAWEGATLAPTDSH